ncbi:hypothetical protein H7849_14270 [Alloacidobacterium dinghuense]|uniref:Uncharacterized protein n=1 Tax=Alloacidobacterium dinghuense TaxID=2763107 RepID=A0A7G8BCR6_9BACT|nr:hypothetical protein [Alloacidobacterium dinghuense]QNI30336.1 hypothetical protein H7849_14270 [Alloacidobacterium dinghuense]
MALRVGAEDKKKVIAAGVLGVGAIGALVYTLMYIFGGSSTPAPPPPMQTAATRPSQPAAPSTTGDHAAVRIPGIVASLDPTLHPEWMAQAESLEYSGHGRNIFSQFSAPPEIEKVQAPIRQSAAATQVPQGPPPPPPIDLKFFGYEARKDGSRRAFLLHGDDVFIASVGDVVDHRYRVLNIAPFSVQIEDLPYQNAQPIPLVQN